VFSRMNAVDWTHVHAGRVLRFNTRISNDEWHRCTSSPPGSRSYHRALQHFPHHGARRVDVTHRPVKMLRGGSGVERDAHHAVSGAPAMNGIHQPPSQPLLPVRWLGIHVVDEGDAFAAER